MLDALGAGEFRHRKLAEWCAQPLECVAAAAPGTGPHPATRHRPLYRYPREVRVCGGGGGGGCEALTLPPAPPPARAAPSASLRLWTAWWSCTTSFAAKSCGRATPGIACVCPALSVPTALRPPLLTLPATPPAPNPLSGCRRPYSTCDMTRRTLTHWPRARTTSPFACGTRGP